MCPTVSWCTKAVTWCAENGIAQGDGAGHFVPGALVTRQTTLAVLYRCLGALEADETALTEVSGSAGLGKWARPGAAWTVENGLVDGSALLPLGEATRSDAAELLAALIAA